MKTIYLSFSFMFFSSLVFGQKFIYDIQLEAMDIPDLGGLQSYAYGTSGDEWLIIGGRLDGLHMRQPFASFDEAGNNNQMIVVNPIEQKVWKRSLSDLPTGIKEQFASTNMQFSQVDDNLVLAGGYAYSPSVDEHITFPYLTIVDTPKAIEAIKNNNSPSSFIAQKTDDYFAVTGGVMSVVGDVYYLVGGHKFTGRYNPHGPTHGPGFVQEYTHEVRPFSLDLEFIEITKLPVIHDEMHLRRRDYNMIPQINNDEEELMVFSGVFQNDADLPWLYPIRIDEDRMEPITDFTQYYNHYHCATMPIYNRDENEMHNLFFGGIAQFYDDEGVMVQDNDVPFVNTIADVIRRSDGSLMERKQEEVMPNLIGAGSEFILGADAPLYSDEVLDGDKIHDSFVKVGYIYGGIKSTAPNIFWVNDGSQSTASSTIYKVSIKRKQLTSLQETNEKEPKILIYPNPTSGLLRTVIFMEANADVTIKVLDENGAMVLKKDRLSGKPGPNYFNLNLVNMKFGIYVVELQIGKEKYVRKLIVNP